MSEQLLTILKLCLLALLYLFFFRVVRAVWAELRAPAPTPAPAGGPRPAPAPPTPAPPAAPQPRRRGIRARPTELLVADPPERRGATYAIAGEVTIGRAGGCAISLPDDTFVSSLHARVYLNGNQPMVEDLGSTNGTFVNDAKVTAPVALDRGDRLKVGNTVMEAR